MKKTNKTFKRFAAITSASLLAACAMAPVFTSMTSYAATNNFTLTAPEDLPANSVITNVRAYKIFKGTYDDTKKTFNVTGFADGVTGATLGMDAEIGAVAAAEAITETNKNEVAKAAAAALGSGTGIAGEYENSTVSFNSDLEVGYYLVLCDVERDDKDAIADATTYDAVSLGMLTVTGTDNAQIGTGIAKVGLPEVMKKVKENSPIEAPAITINGVSFADDQKNEYNDIADYNIGDPVPFKLYGSLPNDLDKYDTYYYKFTDTLGTQFNKPTKMTITVDDTVYVAKYDNTNGWGIYESDTATEKIDSPGISVTNATTGNGFTVEFTDIKSMVTDTTTNTVNKEAIITVAYDAVLNSSANIGLPGQENSVNLTYSNNPNKSGSGTNDDADENTGTTPNDEVIVFTYGAKVNKTFKDAAGNELSPNNEDLAKVTFQIRTDATNADTAIGFTKVDDNGNYTVGGTVKDLKLANGETADTFNIAGLDEGTYYLVETEWIDGFNQAAPIKIVVTADTDNENEWTSGTASDALKKFTYNIANVDGPVTNDVVAEFNSSSSDEGDCIVPVPVLNSKGTTLPGTGGIGTTIFYLGGGAMAAIGGIYLISKRRMRKSEE